MSELAVGGGGCRAGPTNAEDIWRTYCTIPDRRFLSAMLALNFKVQRPLTITIDDGVIHQSGSVDAGGEEARKQGGDVGRVRVASHATHEAPS